MTDDDFEAALTPADVPAEKRGGSALQPALHSAAILGNLELSPSDEDNKKPLISQGSVVRSRLETSNGWRVGDLNSPESDGPNQRDGNDFGSDPTLEGSGRAAAGAANGPETAPADSKTEWLDQLAELWPLLTEADRQCVLAHA